MASLGGLGIGLSLVFGCLLLALVAELYYLLWWKKHISNREIEEEDVYSSSSSSSSNYAKQFFHLFWWKKPSNKTTQDKDKASGQEPDGDDLESGTTSSKDLLINKGFGVGGGEAESVEAELMRLHNLCGPPRFLFTIKEETREDLESEDGKSRSRKGSRTRSLSDLMLTTSTVDSNTPIFFTPLASPRLKSSPPPPLNHHLLGFNNPLFDTEEELSRLRSSPPPKFKFLRDAEEKLLKRLMEEADKINTTTQNCLPNFQDSQMVKQAAIQEKQGSLLGFIVGGTGTGGKNKQTQVLHHLPQYPSASSQVLPLSSSPTTLRPVLDLKNLPIVHPI